jgi:hypothetical protein
MKNEKGKNGNIVQQAENMENKINDNGVSGMRAHVRWITWVSVVLFIFTLAFCSRSGLGWQSPDRYSTEISYIGIGLPHWLFWNRLETNGLPTPPESAPEWLEYRQEYPPGLHIRVVPLILSLSGAVASASLFCGVAVWLKRYRPHARAYRLLPAYMVALIPALLVGAIPISAPGWMRSAMGLCIILVATAAGTAMVRSYRHAAIIGFLVFAAVWWSTNMVDFWYGGEEIEHRFLNENDIDGFAISVPVTVLLSLGTVLVTNYLAMYGKMRVKDEEKRVKRDA